MERREQQDRQRARLRWRTWIKVSPKPGSLFRTHMPALPPCLHRQPCRFDDMHVHTHTERTD